ncbi:hypothetical protein VNO78_16100 [Psophocarpus tetragonolobus]|uniref:Uncharacterized protein n=1 Tax=Psophocarpus tetragonolobus TaxID=3891 RepID=A0AAN9SF70_PSOTE
MVDQPLYPIAVLIYELKNEDIQMWLYSVWRLSTIARALGEEWTRKELVSFLSEHNDNDDEVLLAMVEELGVFILYVGGVEHANVLLPPWEMLCTIEETCVGDKPLYWTKVVIFITPSVVTLIIDNACFESSKRKCLFSIKAFGCCMMLATWMKKMWLISLAVLCDY